MIAFPRLFLERNMQVPLRKSERASLHKIYKPQVSHGLKARKSPCNRKGCKSMCESPSAEVSPKSARAKVSHGRKARVCYVIGKGRKSAICERLLVSRVHYAHARPRARKAASLSRLTKAESLHLSRKAMRTHMRAQALQVCYEFGRSEVSLERMGMRSCASARKPLRVGL